jgi:radical SAM protein with 4Fe4S-binding SPASM domain
MDPDESLFLHKPLFQKYLPLALTEAKKRGVRLIAPASLDDSYIPKKCYYPYHEIGLSPDGSVAFCCNAWDEKKMGNIFLQDFKKEIWNSEAYQTLRKTVNSPEPILRLCRECSALDRGANDFSRHMTDKHRAYAHQILGEAEPHLFPVGS